MMFPVERIYDLDELSQYNFHIHTQFSGCAKSEMTVEAIVKQAKRCKLKKIALTDHIQPGKEVRLSEIIPFLQDHVAQVCPKFRF